METIGETEKKFRPSDEERRKYRMRGECATPIANINPKTKQN